jgi:hypothetical protein
VSMGLSDTTIVVQPGKTVMVDFLIYVPPAFPAGSRYETDIVLLENRNNQNICFTLIIEGKCCAPVASPLDEKYLNMKFHRWHHHFYCTPQQKETRPIDPGSVKKDPAGIRERATVTMTPDK